MKTMQNTEMVCAHLGALDSTNRMSLSWYAVFVAVSLLAMTARADEPARQCVDKAEFSVMYEEGHAAPQSTSLPVQIQFAAIGGRWFFTATDGVVAEGQPMTLTYSFVSDGTMIPGFNGEPASSSNLFATFDANFPGGRTAWKAAFAEAFARYGELTNITYLEVADDGAAFNEAGVLGARGDIRIGMHPIGDGPLAYNFYPLNGGDMVLDTLDVAYFVDPSANFRSLRNVLMHEHGHGLGLGHVLPQDGTKLMEPALNTGFDGPQEDDIRAVQHVYGDWAESNDGIGDEEFIGGPLRDPGASGAQVLTVDDVALERAESADWFGFTAFAGVPIAIRVEPVGSSYSFAPEGGQPSPIDARAARDVALRLWRRVSAQTGELQLVAQIDFNDAGESEYHPPIPYTLAGYMLAEVYSNDNVDDVQRYRLTISNEDIAEQQGAPELLVAEGLNVVTDASTLHFGPTPVGETDGRALSVTNVGEGPLHLTGTPQRVTVQGPGAADFVVGALPAEVAPGASAVLGISFTPTAEGQRVAVVTIPNDDPAQSGFSFIVNGTATAPIQPVLTVSADGELLPNESTFAVGIVTAGESYDLELILANEGNGQLTVFNTASFNGPAGADFAVAQGLPVTLGAGQSTQLLLAYAPSQAGDAQAVFNLSHNGSPNPYRITFVATVEGADVFDDCNGNSQPDDADIAGGFSPDCDGNGLPDECELDSDGDSVIDACDVCPGANDMLDSDGDSVADCLDNCPDVANTDQLDSDGDGTGDACAIVVDDEPVVDDNTEEPVDPDVTEPEDDAVNEQAPEENVEDAKPVADEDNVDTRGTAFCGAGAVGVLPLMLLGMCGMKLRTRRGY